MVGAQDLARIEPAVTSRRWVYLVFTFGPVQEVAMRRRADARRAAAFAAWREKVTAQIGPPNSAAVRLAVERALDREHNPLAPWSPFDDLTESQRERAREQLRRLERREQLTEDREWHELAREVEPPPKGWRVSNNPYHLAEHAWREHVKRSIRTRWGSVAYLVTWERHASGRPHLNVLLDAAALERDFGTLKTKPEPDGRLRTYSPSLRAWFRRAAVAAGFGPVVWFELAAPQSPAFGLYLSKMSRELMAPSVKGQSPWNRPPGFRRFNTSRRLLEDRHWPKGRAAPCPVPACESEPPPGGWCSRTVTRHLEEQHQWEAAAAREHVREILDAEPVGFAVTLESDKPSAADVARAVSGWGRDPESGSTYAAIGRDIRAELDAFTVLE